MEYIARLEKINSKVNCLVEDQFTEALREADEALRSLLVLLQDNIASTYKTLLSRVV